MNDLEQGEDLIPSAVLEAPVPVLPVDTPPSAVATADRQATEDVAREPIEAVPPASPYDLPGSWYVIHSYSGYENKVKANLETRIRSMHMEDADLRRRPSRWRTWSRSRAGGR